MVNKVEQEILKDKKRKFLTEVSRSAKYLGFPTPEVKFWKSRDTTHFKDNERAHIHIESSRICIAESELDKMTYDEIEETASHEVAHLKNASHDRDFYNTQIDTQASLWRPPSGTMHIVYKNSKSSKKSKVKKVKINKKSCNGDFCKKRSELKKCKYCGGYFCEEHLEPRQVGMPRFKGTQAEDIEFMEEYHKEGGHPCLPYSIKYLPEMRKKKKEEYYKILDILCKGPIKSSKKSAEWDPEETIIPTHEKETKRKKYQPKKNFLQRISAHWFLILILIILIGSITTFKLGYFDDYLAGNPQVGGIFNNKFESREISNHGLNTINILRSSKGIHSLSSRQDSYNLAVGLSKEFYVNEKIYMNNEDLSEFSNNYNLRSAKYLSKRLNGLTEEEIDGAIELWFLSPFVAEVLLDESYFVGAMGCYQDVCTFVLTRER